MKSRFIQEKSQQALIRLSLWLIFSFPVSISIPLSGLAGEVPPVVYRIVFYNAENLFDTRDDSLTLDDEFTPQGEMHWNLSRYKSKLHGIFRVISHMGEGVLPSVVCLAEVENKRVLYDLLTQTPLSEGGYHIVHKDSPDQRGIDVGVLFRSDLFRLLHSEFLSVPCPEGEMRSTRDIVYLILMAASGDSLHLFVNHWPSRSEGVVLTEPFRMSAATVLKDRIDSVFRFQSGAAVLVLGDFNEGPSEISIREILNAGPIPDNDNPDLSLGDSLYNLSPSFSSNVRGTYKYQGAWETIDQVMVSGSLMQQGRGWGTTPALVRIFSPEYLLEDDRPFLGKKPFRTYQGPMYRGGYSDHLPVFIDLFIK